LTADDRAGRLPPKLDLKSREKATRKTGKQDAK